MFIIPFKNKHILFTRRFPSAWQYYFINTGQIFLRQIIQTVSYFFRYVFILDKTAPHFSFSNIFYRKELLKDLPVNIYFNGKWSFLKKSTIKDAIQHFYPDEEPRIHFSASMFEGVAVHYLGVNVKNLSLDRSWKNLELGALECSGYTPEGKAVMGLVKLPVVPRKLVPDQRLSWHVPSTWTMEDAVTVPLDYSLVSYEVNLPLSQNSALMTAPGVSTTWENRENGKSQGIEFGGRTQEI